MLKDKERCDFVNDRLSLIQNTEGLTFGTDALLLAGYIFGKYKNGAELGGGSGIISMLLAAREKVGRIDVLEIQEEYVKLILRNAQINSLSDKIHAVKADVRDYASDTEYDIVFTNPPYMKNTSGKPNESERKNAARHEVFGGISDFLLCAKRMLKFGGAFYAVYRPDRLADLVVAMRDAGIEPKRATFVFADTYSEPSMVLVEGKAGAKSGMQLTKPFIIYKDRTHKEYSDDMSCVMDTGSFPGDFKR